MARWPLRPEYIGMQAAPTHTIPVCLFELQAGDGTLHEGGSDIHADGREVPSRHSAADLRLVQGRSTESFDKVGKTRGITIACGDTSDRFGPGRLSRRHSHTKRLRELRARRSADPVHGLRNGTNVLRGSSGGKEFLKARTDGTALTDTGGSKRRRTSLGKAYEIERQRPPPDHPAAIVQTVLQQPTPPTFWRIGEGTRNGNLHPFRNQGFSRLNEAAAATYQVSGRTEDGGSRRHLNVSTVPLGSLEEGPSVESGSTNTAETSGQPAAVKVSQIRPVRSAPASWRPLAATGASRAPSRSGSKKTTPQVNEKNVQQQSARKQQGVAKGVPSAGSTDAGGWESAVTRSNATCTVGIARAGNDDDAHRSLGLLSESILDFPAIADTCGGVVLRLTPGERSLEPWGTTLAPLRAMCDIDPSLSRAGLEYRGVIHAVDGAQELKSHHRIKQRKARDAKALLGKDIRPRTSEPRLRIAGVTSELEVLKTILVRERLIVTLRRLIRRLRHHCSKLQDFLGREVKFRWRYGKSPPEVLVCATQAARTILHTEQQELRVVLAHLRAISLDTVKAISEWRATFETSEAPGYRQISRKVSAPTLRCESPLLRSPAELNETRRCGSIACHSDNNTERVHGHEDDDDVTNNVVTLPGGVQVDQRGGSMTDTQHHNDLSSPEGNDDETAMSKTVSRQFIKSGSSVSSPPTIFLWNGHNYLVKMAHDLDFLDDENVAAPVSAWLGFSVHRNPFLIPPEGHDICDNLRRGHEERCREIAVRRRQRQQHQHRSGGTWNGQRRSSRSRSRSRANSDTNGQRESADGDLPASFSRRLSGQGQTNEPSRAPGNNAGGGMVPPEVTATSQHQRHHPAQWETGSNAAENDIPHRRAGSTTNMTPAIAIPDGEEGGSTFVTEGGMTTADESLGSASTSVEPPISWGLGDLEDEDIPCELSSGEEEEVQWNGGGYLGIPIIPDLPETIRSKASAAAETLCSEDRAEKELESNALDVITNAKRTQEILRQPDQEHSSRVEWLAERSFRNGLRGALVDRHIGVTRLKSVASASCWQDEPLIRRVSTAPAGGIRAVQSARNSGAGWPIAKRATSRPKGHDPNWAALGTSRGGVCVSVDGGVENGDSERTKNYHEPLTPARSHHPAGASRNYTSWRGHATSRLRRPDRVHVGVSEGTTGSASATSLADRSTTASSLQASSSSMSARARARATAIRPTAMRRPFCRNGGKIIITDPGKSPAVRHKAAMLIQAGLLAACTRLSARRLRDNRERAALLIGRNWRRSRARLRMWNAKRLRRVEELTHLAEDRTRERAAHLLQTFFRDIKYRRKRDRDAFFLKNRDHIARELKEQNAVIMVQGAIRRCIAFGRVKGLRHKRRGQAQALIARAARQRAVYVRQKELEEREREEANALSVAMMRKRRSLWSDEAATRVQAWLRGVNCRQTTVSAAFRAKEAPAPTTKVPAPGSKSAHLQAALDALREAHSAVQSTENDKGDTNQGERRRPAEDKSPRARKGATYTGRTDGRPSPNADELRWEARVSERKHTPSRVRAES